MESRNSTDEHILQGRNRYTDIETRLWTQQGRERVGEIEAVALKFILLCVK